MACLATTTRGDDIEFEQEIGRQLVNDPSFEVDPKKDDIGLTDGVENLHVSQSPGFR